jgi:hypothetical protein
VTDGLGFEAADRVSEVIKHCEVVSLHSGVRLAKLVQGLFGDASEVASVTAWLEKFVGHILAYSSNAALSVGAPLIGPTFKLEAFLRTFGREASVDDARAMEAAHKNLHVEKQNIIAACTDAGIAGDDVAEIGLAEASLKKAMQQIALWGVSSMLARANIYGNKLEDHNLRVKAKSLFDRNFHLDEVDV